MNLKEALLLVCDEFEADPSLWTQGKYSDIYEQEGEPTCFCAVGRIMHHIESSHRSLCNQYTIFGPIPDDYDEDPVAAKWSHDVIVSINDAAPDLTTALAELRAYAEIL